MEERPRARGETLLLWTGLLVPPAAVAAQVAAKALAPDVFERVLHTEQGVVQNLTAAFALLAAAAALRLAAGAGRVAWRGFRAFALALAACCLVFAGEETSWGQHWLGFRSPAVFAARNDQREVNLHNFDGLEPWFDALPRNALSALALAGGAAALLRPRGARPDLRSRGPAGWLAPTRAAATPALAALLVTLPAKLVRPLPDALAIKPGETKELCLALFLWVYAGTLLGALRREP